MAAANSMSLPVPHQRAESSGRQASRTALVRHRRARVPVTQSESELAVRDGQLAWRTAVRSGPVRIPAAAPQPHELRRGRGEDGELGARHPGLGVRGERDRHAVELGDGVQQRARVDVVREQPGRGSQHTGAELAQRQLAQAAARARPCPAAEGWWAAARSGRSPERNGSRAAGAGALWPGSPGARRRDVRARRAVPASRRGRRRTTAPPAA